MGAGAELFYDQPLELVQGDGVWLYDRLGQPYLDVYNNVHAVDAVSEEPLSALEFREFALGRRPAAL